GCPRAGGGAPLRARHEAMDAPRPVEVTVEKSIEVLAGMAAALAALAAFAVYRWQERKRVRQAETWVNAYRSTRYGELPTGPTPPHPPRRSRTRRRGRR